MSKPSYFCYADGAINPQKLKDGAGNGVVVFKDDNCIGMWGKYFPDIDTSYKAEMNSVLYGGKICIENHYRPVKLFNDCVTKHSIQTNGFAEKFDNMVFKLGGKLEYQQLKGTRNYNLHNKRFCVADKIARY